MDKKLKKMFYTIGILGTAAAMAERMNHNVYMTGWITMVCVWIYVFRFTMMVYDDCKQIYPANRTCPPFCLKKMFFWLYENERIPKCLMIQAGIIISLFNIYTILFVILGISNMTTYAIDIFFSYFILGFLLILYGYYGVYISVFLERFKIFNKHNFRYAVFITYNKTCKWPTSTVLGKCEVLGSIKRRGKMYVTIKMLETGVVYEDILVISELHTNRKIYKLHEICDVKYIV